MQHPNVVQIYDAMPVGHRRALVFELIEGASLHRVMLAQTLSTERALTLAIQIAEGLKAIHVAGLLHLDIKPANVMVSGVGERERATIIDLGLSRPLEARRDCFCRGTQGYMAPEVLNGEAPTIQSDLYSFGATFFEMVTGRKLEPTMYSLDHEQVRNRLPTDQLLGSILKRLLDPLPAARFASTAELLVALEGAFEAHRAEGAQRKSAAVTPRQPASAAAPRRWWHWFQS